MKLFTYYIVLLLFSFTLNAQNIDSVFKNELFKPHIPLIKTDTISMVFIGDVMMHKGQIYADYNPFLSQLSTRFKNADIAIANMEFTLSGLPYTGYPCFSAPDEFAQYVNNQGINVFLIANNHILDKGINGLKRTIATYKQMSNKIWFTGASANAQEDSLTYPLLIDIKGLKLAIINFTYGTNNSTTALWPKVNKMNLEDIDNAIKRAKNAKADYIIACPHWGEEYKLTHSASQEKWAKILADKGVDIIIGTHPHVVQDYTEIYTQGLFGKEKIVPVYYSLGNAVSNMSAVNTQLELMVHIKIIKSNSPSNKQFKVIHKAEFLWCTLPWKLTNSYCTIPIKDFINKKHLWKIGADYDKMIETYNRVKRISGINDN